MKKVLCILKLECKCIEVLHVLNQTLYFEYLDWMLSTQTSDEDSKGFVAVLNLQLQGIMPNDFYLSSLIGA